MKKNKNRKIKVNAYYNGMDTINNIVGATSVVGSALSGISDEVLLIQQVMYYHLLVHLLQQDLHLDLLVLELVLL